MSAALGALLGTGLLLVAAPFLWPRRAIAPRPTATGRLTDRLARAGLAGVSPAVFVVMSALVGACAGALALAITGLPVVALLAASAAAVLPSAAIGQRIRARVRAARALWPEATDHLVGAIRAGVPLPEALAALAGSGPAPLRPGFAVLARRWRETGTLDPAIDAAKAHFADPTADRLLEILRMARQVGGTELPSVLRDLAAALRADLALRSEVEARQSWVTSAAKLGAAAPWVVLLLLATRPEAERAYGSPAGVALILGALLVTVVAYRLMLAVGRLPDDRRWFR